LREGERQVAPEFTGLVEVRADQAEQPCAGTGGHARWQQPGEAQRDGDQQGLNGPQQLAHRRSTVCELLQGTAEEQSGHGQGVSRPGRWKYPSMRLLCGIPGQIPKPGGDVCAGSIKAAAFVMI